MATQKKTGSLWLLKDMETPYRHAHPAAFFSPGGLLVEGAEFRLILATWGRKKKSRSQSHATTLCPSRTTAPLF